MIKIKHTILLTVSLTILVTAFFSCKKISKKTQPVAYEGYAAFDWFDYKGTDDYFSSVPKSDNEYYNPILAGFYPDPSICKANGKYYLITSTFTYFPGIPVFESEDLVNWKQIGHVITRKEQGDFSGQRVSRGMFAPTIRYHDGTFYVICTNVSGVGNFIVTATNPAGPWSDPVIVPVDGIDPDLFFDDNGKVYITHNGPPPNNAPLYDGHRAIYSFEYDLTNQKVIGEPKLLVNGGTDISKKPVWIEAPHILKKDAFYYLICAEGGTGYNHSEVVFRSEKVDGPYISYANNPILTQRHLNPERDHAISTTGHADFVELPNGDWWSVFLGCRPYETDFYNTGRETFLMPVKWENGWPVIIGGTDALPVVNTIPELTKPAETTEPTTGNFDLRDDFNRDTLNFNWNFIRTPMEKWYQLDTGFLYIKPREESIHTLTNYSFIGRRQQHQQFEASVKLSYQLTDTLQAVGLVAFQNEKFYLFIGKRLTSSGKAMVFVEETAGTINDGKPAIIAEETLKDASTDLLLRIDGDKRYYSFYYKTSEEGSWKLLAGPVDASILSTKVAGGFTGSYLAMYASADHFGDQ